MTPLDDLLGSIFEDRQSPLYPEFAGWVQESRRFKAFAGQYATKIRAKLKNVRDEGGLQDLRAELATAALLLREDRFEMEYEQYIAAKVRGPDFTITFKTHTRFNVEVRRIRTGEWSAGDPEARLHKLMTVLCDKAGQMPSSIINLLWLIPEQVLTEADLIQAITRLRGLAERKDDGFFTRRGYAGGADFLKHYTRLSGIVLHQAGSHTLWLNPVARHKTPSDMVNAIQRLTAA